MSDFIGRTKELAALEKAYHGNESSFIPIYGRRRVGKSELILHFVKNKPSLYAIGSRSTASVQLREFLDTAAIVLKKPILSTIQPRDWKTVLQAVCSQWDSRRKLVLAFDEFQWMVEASPELPSVLQQLWDMEWQKSGRILLILCGSYIGFMEREVLGHKSPLFGRRTGQILLRPFSFSESCGFHRKYSLEDKARIYFLCGGIPLYLNLFKIGKSVEANIQDNFFDEYAPLYREAEFLMREELSDTAHYYSILSSIAASNSTVKALSESLGFDSRALPYYLQQLVSIGYIEKVYPLTESAPSARHVRYRITDPLLRFWFKFIHPRAGSILQLGSSIAFSTLVKPVLPSYFGSCFEALCRESLAYLYAQERITAEFEIGQYWDSNCQIDVVGYRKDNWVDLGECKWGSVGSARSLAMELEKKVPCYPNKRNATIGRIIFTRSRISYEKSNQVKLFCLEDLYDKSFEKQARSTAL